MSAPAVPCRKNGCGRNHEYCDACFAILLRRYPQGWRYYAGDTCKHGVYVGGCGIDWMCGRCENGDG